jgi:hypothetical protein
MKANIFFLEAKRKLTFITTTFMKTLEHNSKHNGVKKDTFAGAERQLPEIGCWGALVEAQRRCRVCYTINTCFNVLETFFNQF